MLARRLPPLNGLRAFETAARHLSISAAADELNVTPAAVSQQIKGLEGQLGLSLFRRMNRALALTEHGRLLLPGLSDGFDLLDRAVAEVRQAQAGGPLNLSTSPSFASKWLIPRLDRFQNAHPEIEVRITAGMDLTDFRRDDVDCAVRFGRGRYDGVEAIWLLGEEVFPVCSPDLLEGPHGLRGLDQLRHHRLLHDGTPMPDDVTPDWRMWLQAARVDDVDPSHGTTLTPWTMVVQAAIEGQGVALGRRALVADDLAAGRLVRPFDLGLPLPFSHWLVYPPGAERRPKVRAFRDWLVAEAEAARETAETTAGEAMEPS
ncbi:MAG: transcriptional regulator GcvA [Rhodospirillaceae bacterium]|nr:transcriptional regulator GcvA [Rhodospirillaceae bacterium]MBT5895088.1 transcriptional regulator GcvA [Rhodospirillaceae bacterium]MBT7760645.1 transcriptional regulator GcvA [Rhodospirillaceae bacterium]